MILYQHSQTRLSKVEILDKVIENAAKDVSSVCIILHYHVPLALNSFQGRESLLSNISV